MSRHVVHRPTRVSRAALVAGLSLLAACGGGEKAPTESQTTGSSGSNGVHVDLSTDQVEVVTPPVGTVTAPIMSCFVDIRATVGGSGAGTWVDGEFRFYDLRDTTRQIASLPFAGSELIQAFGTGTTQNSDVQKSRWQLTASAPFIGEMSTRYTLTQSGSTMATATTRFRCAPPVPPGAASPAVPQVSVTPASGALDVGAPVQITVSASAPAGAYFTRIRITGACLIEQDFMEQFQTAVSHTVSIPLNYPCALGAPIGVSAIVYDVLTNSSTTYAQYPIALVDSQRPTVWARVPYGDYVAPDSFTVYVATRDNYRVGTFYWEVLPIGTKDSVVLTDSLVTQNGGEYDGALNLKVPTTWIGQKIQLRLYARDAKGLASDTITSPLDSIRVH